MLWLPKITAVAGGICGWQEQVVFTMERLAICHGLDSLATKGFLIAVPAFLNG